MSKNQKFCDNHIFRFFYSTAQRQQQSAANQRNSASYMKLAYTISIARHALLSAVRGDCFLLQGAIVLRLKWKRTLTCAV